LSCYNQCVQNVSGGNTVLMNDTMLTLNTSQVNCTTSGCTTDTVPVAFYGSLENYVEGGVKIPGATDLAKAREILQELRRRAAQMNRPQAERDYLDRLLKTF
jgi:hypothetical protein